MLVQELRSKIDKLRDLFWSGGIANPMAVIEQVSYLIFMKRLEDMDIVHQHGAERRKERYRRSTTSARIVGMSGSDLSPA
ncbi:MAG TPA: hypothetical protein ENH12_00135 [Proteobacteria bacterium]|nr:hypothetical protein [Pseudomonadota bacterium]